MHMEMDRSEYFILALFPSLGRRAALLASKIEKSVIISSSGDWILASLIVAIVRRKRIFMVHRGIHIGAMLSPLTHLHPLAMAVCLIPKNVPAESNTWQDPLTLYSSPIRSYLYARIETGGKLRFGYLK